MGLLQKISGEQLRTLAPFRSGDLVKVHVRITEGDKERIQIFEGVVIRIRQGGKSASFTVRKVSYGVGVERLFPFHSPSVDKVEVVTRHKVRRARLFYLRERRGKAARLKERDVRGLSAHAAAAAKAAKPSAPAAGDAAESSPA